MLKLKRVSLALALAIGVSSGYTAQAQGKYFYTQTNNVANKKNAVAMYERNDNGSLTFKEFYATKGTGINNDTYGKLGPQDNDSQIVVTKDKKYMYVVNVHSNTVSGFAIQKDGSLEPVEGSPFKSHGIAPVSVNVSGNILMVANRNEDYHQKKGLKDSEGANYATFLIQADGSLEFADKHKVVGFHKPTQIHASPVMEGVFFGNCFQVDADFDGDEELSFLAGPAPSVQGQLQVFKVGKDGKITETYKSTLPETIKDYTYIKYPGVPTMPLGIWAHPTKNILYVGFVTRNQVGVYEYTEEGHLYFKGAVENGGQDICWLLTNKTGTFMYAVNNLPRVGTDQKSSTISVYDISGANALKPVETQIIDIPNLNDVFENNRKIMQPGSTAFEIAMDPSEKYVYIINQRVNQTEENTKPEGNAIHIFSAAADGKLKYMDTRQLEKDGFPTNARTQGAVALDL